MKMLQGFGLLLNSVGKRLVYLAEMLGMGASKQVSLSKTTGKTLIWDVVDGPFTREEFNEEALKEFGIDEDDNYCLVVKMEEGGKLGLVNLWFPEIEDANKLKDHFKYHIEPLELIE